MKVVKCKDSERPHIHTHTHTPTCSNWNIPQRVCVVPESGTNLTALHPGPEGAKKRMPPVNLPEPEGKFQPQASIEEQRRKLSHHEHLGPPPPTSEYWALGRSSFFIWRNHANKLRHTCFFSGVVKRASKRAHFGPSNVQLMWLFSYPDVTQP